MSNVEGFYRGRGRFSVFREGGTQKGLNMVGVHCGILEAQYAQWLVG